MRFFIDATARTAMAGRCGETYKEDARNKE